MGFNERNEAVLATKGARNREHPSARRQHAMNETEHGGRGDNSKSERQHGDGSEARATPQLPGTEANIVEVFIIEALGALLPMT
jgi:hypothetical protein